MKLYEARRLRGISQRNIADILGVSQGLISHWEVARLQVPRKYQKLIEKMFGHPIDFVTIKNTHQVKKRCPRCKQVIRRRKLNDEI